MITHDDQPFEQMADTPTIKVNPHDPAQGNARIAEDLVARADDLCDQPLSDSQKHQLTDLTVKIKMDLDRIGSILWRRRCREIFDKNYASHLSRDSQKYLAKLILNFNEVTSLVRGTQVGALKRAHARAEALVQELTEIADQHHPEDGYFDPMTSLKVDKMDAKKEAQAEFQIESELRKGDRVAEPAKERCYDLIHSIFESILEKNMDGELKPLEALPIMEEIFKSVCSPEKGALEIGVAEARLKKLAVNLKKEG